MEKMSLSQVQAMQLNLMKKVDKFCSDNQITYYLIAGSCLGAIRHSGFIPWDDDIDLGMMRKDYDRFIKLFYSTFSDKEYFLQNYNSDPNFSLALSRICIRGTYVDVPSERYLDVCKNTYIDVFPLDNVPDDDKLRLRQHKVLYRIDRLIGLKNFHIYRNSLSEIIVKYLVSMILKVFPLKYLQNRRIQEMTKYDGTDTNFVCSTTSKYGYRKQVMEKKLYGVPAKCNFEGEIFNVPAKTHEYLTHLYGPNYMSIPPENRREKPNDVYQI